jgi:ribosome-binding protein aMBF1 (putative translation factor)
MKKKNYVKGLGKLKEGSVDTPPAKSATKTGQLSPAESFLRGFASSVRRARDAKGISQKELAERLGTSQSAIARLEACAMARGDMNPGITFICDVAEALGMKIGYRPFLRKPGPEIKLDGLVFDEWIEGA